MSASAPTPTEAQASHRGPTKNLDYSFTVVLTAEDGARFERRAQTEDRKKSALARVAIMRYLDAADRAEAGQAGSAT